MNRQVIGWMVFLSFMSNAFAMSTKEVAAKVLPAVVQVGIAEGDVITQIHTVGSGVCVSPNGDILTARHNVQDADHVFVKFSDGRAYPVIYYTADAHADLVALKIFPKPEERMPFIKAEVSGAQPGEQIMVFGFPFPSMLAGNYATVSHGVVSAVGTSIIVPAGSKSDSEEMGSVGSGKISVHTAENPFLLSLTGTTMAHGYLQIDAMVNPGSSGGPVVNMDGEVIGIVRSMISNSGANVGVNFAIPLRSGDPLVILIGLED